MLLAVTPAKQMDPIEVLRKMQVEFEVLQSGFSAFDYEARKVVKVKAPICVFESDMDSMRQVNPFKGSSGFSFCHRCMINKETTLEDEDNLEMRTRQQLDDQIEEIENARTQNEKKELGRNYGVVPE